MSGHVTALVLLLYCSRVVIMLCGLTWISVMQCPDIAAVVAVVVFCIAYAAVLCRDSVRGTMHMRRWGQKGPKWVIFGPFFDPPDTPFSP